MSTSRAAVAKGVPRAHHGGAAPACVDASLLPPGLSDGGDDDASDKDDDAQARGPRAQGRGRRQRGGEAAATAAAATEIRFVSFGRKHGPLHPRPPTQGPQPTHGANHPVAAARAGCSMPATHGGAQTAAEPVAHTPPHGLPRHVHHVFNCRTLKNPHVFFKGRTGLDKSLRTEFLKGRDVAVFVDACVDHVLTAVRDADAANTNTIDSAALTFTFGFGCEFGRHRSVSCCLETAARVGAALKAARKGGAAPAHGAAGGGAGAAAQGRAGSRARSRARPRVGAPRAFAVVVEHRDVAKDKPGKGRRGPRHPPPLGAGAGAHRDAPKGVGGTHAQGRCSGTTSARDSHGGAGWSKTDNSRRKHKVRLGHLD